MVAKLDELRSRNKFIRGKAVILFREYQRV